MQRAHLVDESCMYLHAEGAEGGAEGSAEVMDDAEGVALQTGWCRQDGGGGRCRQGESGICAEGLKRGADCVMTWMVWMVWMAQSAWTVLLPLKSG